MKIPCPQCGGEVRLQETTGFVGCPFCGVGLVLDLTGVRPHMLYRPRHGPEQVAPLLRRWCDAQRLPPPSGVSTPHLVYRPFWRFALQGRPRLAPAWPAREACWTDVPLPEGEQVIYDASIVGGACVMEPSIAEAAGRSRLFGEAAAATPAGELVHVPFYEVQASIGASSLGLSVEACSGRVYPDRVPLAPRTSEAAAVTAGIVGFLVMVLEAMLIPPLWPAAGAVALTAVGLYWAVVGGTGRAAA